MLDSSSLSFSITLHGPWTARKRKTFSVSHKQIWTHKKMSLVLHPPWPEISLMCTVATFCSWEDRGKSNFYINHVYIYIYKY